MDWYPFYPAKYRAKTLNLNLEQDAIYRRMIDWYMENRVALPNNSQAISRICEISLEKWKEHESAILLFFTQSEGRLINSTCEIELSRQDNLSLKRSNAAKEAAEKRKQYSTKSTASEQLPSISPAIAKIHDMTGQDIPITNVIGNDEKSKTKPFKVLKINLPDFVSPKIWDQFVAHRKSVKSPLTERAAELLILELTRLHADGDDVDAVINQTIMNGWKGLFKVKNGRGNNSPPKPTYSNVLNNVGNNAAHNVSRKVDHEIY